MEKIFYKRLMYLICACAVLYLSTQPPVKSSAQPIVPNMKVQAQQQKVDSLSNVLDRKANELKSLIKEQKPKVKVVYRTKYVHVPPKQITVYTRINGEVTEHKIKADKGFYMLDLKHEPETNVITETYYIDTCLNYKKRTLWKQLFGK